MQDPEDHDPSEMADEDEPEVLEFFFFLFTSSLNPVSA